MVSLTCRFAGELLLYCVVRRPRPSGATGFRYEPDDLTFAGVAHSLDDVHPDKPWKARRSADRDGPVGQAFVVPSGPASRSPAILHHCHN
jgi:hypothetical protein